MKKFLKHPIVILGGVALGVVIGVFNTPISNTLGIRNFAETISLPGQLYLYFLQMTVNPIIITAISSSLGKLMRNKSSLVLIKKIVAVFVLCMIVCALVGIAAGSFGRPGSGLSEDTHNLLAKLLSSEQDEASILEIALGSGDDFVQAVQRPGMSSFFTNMIPSNIFHALSLGSVMAILFFSIIFGVAIGFLPEESSTLLINMCTAIFQAFQKLIGWSLYLLPFGLVCLLAGQIAMVGVNIFVAMSKFIILYCVGTVVIFIICTVIIWIKSGIRSPIKVLSILFEPILLAFATRNSMAALPSAINSLDKGMGFNSNSVNLTLPLGMTLGRFGNIFYFALGVFFVAQIYSMPLLPLHYLIILIGVVFAGTATAGASGIVTLSMLAIVLDPLSLPMEAVLIIFMAIDSIIEPFRTYLNVHVNMAATTLIAERGEKEAELFTLENAIKNAEQKIQRSVRAKLAGTADENDEKTFNELSAEIECLREEKRQVLKKSGGIEILVFIQDFQNRPPLLYRSNGILQGAEIHFLNEIGRCLDKKVIIKDSADFNNTEIEKTIQEADIIAGSVTRSSSPPLKDFVFSAPWLSLKNKEGIKTPVCFLINKANVNASRIESVIKDLITKDFIRSFIEPAK